MGDAHGSEITLTQVPFFGRKGTFNEQLREIGLLKERERK